MSRRFLAAACGIAVFMVTAAPGCGSNDAGVTDRNTAPANIINFPNHFASVANKCDGHGHRVYQSDHGDNSNGGGALAVIADPDCR